MHKIGVIITVVFFVVIVVRIDVFVGIVHVVSVVGNAIFSHVNAVSFVVAFIVG